MKSFNSTIVTCGNYYEPQHIPGMVEDDPYAHAGTGEKTGMGIRILTEREFGMVSAQDFDFHFTVEEGEGEEQWWEALEVLSPWLRHDSLRTAAMDLQRLIARGDISETAADAMQDWMIRRVA